IEMRTDINLPRRKSIKSLATTLLSLLLSTAHSSWPEQETQQNPYISTRQKRLLFQIVPFQSIMKLTALLLAFLPTLITAGCYTTGESWDRSLGPPAVNAACKKLAGDYRGDQSKVQRLPQQNGQCYVFELKRIPSGSDAELLSITKDDCKDGMNKELFGCDRGGKSSYTNWTYK
ncbi:MAG: hypothetical protein Q9185_005907, partial [Variospora sp. 1 TL-2023]